MLAEMNTMTKEADPAPTLEDVANCYSLTVDDSNRHWTYIRDVNTNAPLTVYRPWTFKAMTADDLEADIESHLEKPEPVTDDAYWAAEQESRKRRRSLITGRFK